MNVWGLLSVVLLAAVGCAAMEPPVLPERFVATFTNPPGPLQPLTGTWYYDYVERVQRVDGGNQASCNRIKADGQYCTTFLTDEHLYVVFPFTRECCTEASPGLIRPDWLRTDNATYRGQELVNGRSCAVWLALGSSANYWLAEGDGKPCLLDDGGFNWTFSSFAAGNFSASITAVPAYCQNAAACPA